MAVQFQPDQVSFRDPEGYGNWDISHGREHLQFVQAIAALGKSIPDYPVLSFLGTDHDDRSSISQSHYTAHQLLRSLTGVTGPDYTQFNLDDESDFYDFTLEHAQEHAQLRAALGIS